MNGVTRWQTRCLLAAAVFLSGNAVVYSFAAPEALRQQASSGQSAREPQALGNEYSAWTRSIPVVHEQKKRSSSSSLLEAWAGEEPPQHHKHSNSLIGAPKAEDALEAVERQRESRATALLDEVAKLARSQGQVGLKPKEKAKVLEIVTTLREEILPGVKQTHKESQEEVNTMFQALLDCETTVSTHLEDVFDFYEVVEENRKAARDCISEESKLYGEKQKACQVMTLLKQDLMPGEQPTKNPGVHAPENDILQYLKAMSSSFCGAYDEYYKKSTKCRALEQNYTHKVKEECMPAQGRFETSVCEYQTSVSKHCSDYGACRADALERYQAILTKVKAAVEEELVEFRAVDRVECIWKAWNLTEGSPCTIDEGQIERCMKSDPCIDEFKMVYPEVPEAQVCPPKASEHSVTRFMPCTDSFTAHHYLSMTSVQGPVSERVLKACRECAVSSTTTTTTTTRTTTTSTTTTTTRTTTTTTTTPANFAEEIAKMAVPVQTKTTTTISTTTSTTSTMTTTVTTTTTTAVTTTLTTTTMRTTTTTTTTTAASTSSATTSTRSVSSSMTVPQGCPTECQRPSCQAGDFSLGGWLLDDGACTVACSEPDAQGIRRCGRGEAFEASDDSFDCSKCVKQDQTCVLWGDPHIVPFDREVRPRNGRGSNVNLYNYGDFWLVKNSQVSIQGRYWSTRGDGNSQTRALAIGGSFLRDNKLIVEPLDGIITWNDQEILEEFPGTFESPALVYIKYHNEAEVARTGGRHKSIKGLDIMLPLGVRLTVNRYKAHLDALITMRQLPGGIDGHCGSFNNDANDDTTKLISERIGAPVTKKANLFQVKDYSFVGCFVEKASDHDLTDKLGNNMNSEECAMACVDFAWFGVQDTEQCFCGNTYGKHGEASECNCDGEGKIGSGKQCIYGYFDSVQPPEQNLEDCDSDTLDRAESLCGDAFDSEEIESVEMRALCTFDVCFGGPEFAAEDAWAAHVMAPCASVADVQRVCSKAVGSCADGLDICDMSGCTAYADLGWWDGEIRLLSDGQARSDATLTSEVEMEHRPGICITDNSSLVLCDSGQCARQTGLLAEYFFIGKQIKDFPDYDSLKADLKRVDAEVNWAVTRDAWPWRIYKADYFGVRWMGAVRISRPGMYTFKTESDDGSSVLIDGQEVVDNGGLHSMRSADGEISLTAGLHGVLLRYWENKGGAGMIFSYAGPDTGEEMIVVPSKVLVPSEAMSLR